LRAGRGNRVCARIEPALRRRIVELAEVARRDEIHALRDERSALADVRRRDGERESAAEANDPLDLPPAEHVRHRSAARQPWLPWPERQIVAVAERGAMTLVVPRVALVGVQVPRVRRIVRLDLARAVVGVLRQLVVREEEEAVAVALLQTERQPVELRAPRVG